ncbi:MAG: hypothetical protein ABID87_01000 [Chloroflexota bacterium]
MKCPLCGLEFNPDEAQAACASCPLARGCHLVRCPNCGYEIPRETGLVKLLKSWSKKHGTGREG